MSRFKYIVAAVFFLLLSCGANASKIKPLELTELTGLSDVVVVAKVISVKKIALDSRTPSLDDEPDEVTIKVASVLKGTIQTDKITIILQSRGVKNFDPKLSEQDTGVFFLREVNGSSAKLAYWGSAAIFQKPNYILREK
jgi:hypothetical protein